MRRRLDPRLVALILTGASVAVGLLVGTVVVLLSGCSSATVFQYTRPDGTSIMAQSAKQQSEESAKWTIKITADGSLSLDLGTKGTSPVNMTADTLDSLIGLAGGLRAAP